jgi:hypothetical protein
MQIRSPNAGNRHAKHKSIDVIYSLRPISPDARKEVLKRLLKLNHEIHEQEVKAGLHIKGKTKKKQKADTTEQMKLF